MIYQCRISTYIKNIIKTIVKYNFVPLLYDLFSVCMVKSISEIAELYMTSCQKHNTTPLQCILDHLKAIDLTKQLRQPLLSLKSIQLAPSDCEALEEVLKRVSEIECNSAKNAVNRFTHLYTRVSDYGVEHTNMKKYICLLQVLCEF